MPPALILPLVTMAVGTAATLANSNAQNKTAIKNADNANASSVANNKQATANAYAANNAWQSANPNPTNAAIAPVPAGAAGSPAHSAEMAKFMHAAQAISPLITKALSQGQGGATAPTLQPGTPVTAPQPVNAQSIMQRVGQS